MDWERYFEGVSSELTCVRKLLRRPRRRAGMGMEMGMSVGSLMTLRTFLGRRWRIGVRNFLISSLRLRGPRGMHGEYSYRLWLDFLMDSNTLSLHISSRDLPNTISILQYKALKLVFHFCCCGDTFMLILHSYVFGDQFSAMRRISLLLTKSYQIKLCQSPWIKEPEWEGSLTCSVMWKRCM